VQAGRRVFAYPVESAWGGIKAGFLAIYRSVFDLMRKISLEATQAARAVCCYTQPVSPLTCELTQLLLTARDITNFSPPAKR
jgi:hypothetical protein